MPRYASHPRVLPKPGSDLEWRDASEAGLHTQKRKPTRPMTVHGRAIVWVLGSWKFHPTAPASSPGSVPLVAFGDLSVGDEEAEVECHVLDRQGHEVELAP